MKISQSKRDGSAVKSTGCSGRKKKKKLGSIPRTHIVAYNQSNVLFWSPQTRGMYTVHVEACRPKGYIYKINNSHKAIYDAISSWGLGAVLGTEKLLGKLFLSSFIRSLEGSSQFWAALFLGELWGSTTICRSWGWSPSFAIMWLGAWAKAFQLSVGFRFYPSNELDGMWPFQGPSNL